MLPKLLLLHEGLSLKPYRCATGNLTIGVGRNLEDMGISREEALLLLDNDIARVRAEMAEAIPWYLQLTAPHRAVLEDIAFNLGTGGLLKLKEALALFQAGKFEKAARELFHSRAFQMGTGPDKEGRRERLLQMIRSGRWPADWT